MEDVLYVPGTWETDENVKLLYTLYRYVTYDHFILNRFSLLILFAYICRLDTVPQRTYIKKWIRRDNRQIPSHSHTSWDPETTDSEIKEVRF